jgi:hypothetical protein
MLVKESGFAAGDRANLLEVLQRCRRIETRLTRFLEMEGIETGIKHPWWVDGQVMVPSTMITIDAILNCIPESWSNPVQVVLKEGQDLEVLCQLMLEE